MPHNKDDTSHWAHHLKKVLAKANRNISSSTHDLKVVAIWRHTTLYKFIKQYQ